LRRAFWVVTNRLLGHTLDHNTSTFVLPPSDTFYERMTICQGIAEGFGRIIATIV
jgi:hypothetical protein